MTWRPVRWERGGEPPAAVEAVRLVQTQAKCPVPGCTRSAFNVSAEVNGRTETAWFCWDHDLMQADPRRAFATRNANRARST